MTTIPDELLADPGDRTWNPAWLDPQGEFHVADSHSSLNTEHASGYGHYKLGWVRIYFVPKNRELGFETHSKINGDQRAALVMLAQSARPSAILAGTVYEPVADRSPELVMQRVIKTAGLEDAA